MSLPSPIPLGSKTKRGSKRTSMQNFFLAMPLCAKDDTSRQFATIARLAQSWFVKTTERQKCTGQKNSKTFQKKPSLAKRMVTKCARSDTQLLGCYRSTQTEVRDKTPPAHDLCLQPLFKPKEQRVRVSFEGLQGSE